MVTNDHMAFANMRDSGCNPGQCGDYSGMNIGAKGNIRKLRLGIVAFKLIFTGRGGGEL